MRCYSTKGIELDSLVGRLTTFELDNFDNYVLNTGNIESYSNAKLTLGKKNKKKAKKVESEKESTNEDIEIIEAFCKRILQEVKGGIKERFL